MKKNPFRAYNPNSPNKHADEYGMQVYHREMMLFVFVRMSLFMVTQEDDGSDMPWDSIEETSKIDRNDLLVFLDPNKTKEEKVAKINELLHDKIEKTYFDCAILELAEESVFRFFSIKKPVLQQVENVLRFRYHELVDQMIQYGKSVSIVMMALKHDIPLADMGFKTHELAEMLDVFRRDCYTASLTDIIEQYKKPV